MIGCFVYAYVDCTTVLCSGISKTLVLARFLVFWNVFFTLYSNMK